MALASTQTLEDFAHCGMVEAVYANWIGMKKALSDRHRWQLLECKQMRVSMHRAQHSLRVLGCGVSGARRRRSFLASSLPAFLSLQSSGHVALTMAAASHARAGGTA